ncbi:hypothetical protein [Sorangium sp. So ce388]|uniref:hypothetical protein n=1 Tax=Sorangium sp. So ce388 TaxID=3133309 RepID=UPI003F5B88B9
MLRHRPTRTICDRPAPDDWNVAATMRRPEEGAGLRSSDRGRRTDGTDRLRYLATKDTAPPVHARRQTSEEAYRETMKSRFAPGI